MTRVVSNTFSLTVRDPGVLPTWLDGVAVNTWVELNSTAMSLFPPSVDPGRDSGGPHAKMDAWCGLSIDTRNSMVWSVGNGGHDDYHGNEVMKFTLGDNTPAWVEVTPSSTAVSFTVPNNAAVYSNGKPASAHTYYSQQLIESRNLAMRAGTQSAASVGNPFVPCHGFALGTTVGADGWDTTTFPDLPGSISSGGHGVCKNPATEDVFFFSLNYNVWKWTNTTNAWTTLSATIPGGGYEAQYSPTAYDTVRDRILILGNTATHHHFTPSTGVFVDVTFSGAAASIFNGVDNKSIGMVYVPSLDAYLVKRTGGGSTVYIIDAGTFAVTELSVSGGATIVASPASIAIWNRWLYAPNLGGIVLFPRYSSNAWFLRIE